MDLTTSLNETSVSNWLNKFVAKRKHTVEIGEPLFRFHMTRDEYESLKKILSRTMKYGVGHSVSKEWYAGFVLYCSEWFRREYSLDWSWIPILKSLGFELTYAQRVDAIRKGLVGFWNRPLSKYQNENSDYLGSLFREGGLPSNLLSNDANHYQSTFYSIFERYQEIKELGREQVEAFISTKISRLPEVFSTQESIELIANMVEQLDTLVYQFGLDKQANPAAYLDAHKPHWREDFPLPLEDETGTAFLGQLLNRATDEVKRVAKTRKTLACAHYISFVNQAISSRITLPHSYEFDIAKELLTTSRVDLTIAEGDTPIASLGSAYIQFENAKASIRFRSSSVSVRRQNYSKELYICVMQSGRKIADVRLTGSTIDLGEAPLVLTETDLDWRIIGQASVNVKQPKVGLLLPSQAKIEIERGEETPTQLKIKDLSLQIFEGKCVVSVSPFEKYTITTGAEKLLGNNLSLKGVQLPWSTTPALVFKGVPSIGPDLGSEVTYEPENIRSFLGEQPITEMCKTEVNGQYLFTSKNNDGVILFRKRIGILPRDFDIELVGGTSHNRGCIKVITNAPCLCKIMTEGVKEESNIKKDGYRELSISVESLPPASVTLKVTAGLMAEPILVELPFPSKGAIAFNSEGQSLPHKLTIDDLIGSRLHLFATSGNPVQYQIEAVNCSVREHCHKTPYYRWSYKVSDKPVEVSLYGLKDTILELLSLSDKLDSAVELTITGPIRPMTFVISRYSTTIDYDKTTNSIISSSRTLLSSEKIKPVLISLSAPEQKPIVLESKLSEGVPTGEFELPNFLENGGPWLVIPAKGSEIHFRAKFIPGQPADRDDLEIKTLQKASIHFHHVLNNHVIDDVLTQMSEKWLHSGWQYLKDIYQNYAYLPLTTFEVWRHLLKNTRALAVALLRLENTETLIPHLERELPIFWEFIPLADWQYAINLMRGTFKNANLPDDVIQQQIEKRMKKIVDAIPVLSAELSAFLLHNESFKPLPAVVMETIIQTEEKSWFQRLLQQHAGDDRWPHEYGRELSHRCTDLPMPFELKVNHSYQSGVVFLPAYAAAVATGVISADEVNQLSADAIFHFRKLSDFDREWFEPMYRYFVTHFFSRQ